MPELKDLHAYEAAPQARPAAIGSAISSIAMAVPEQIVTNAPISARLGVADDWIQSRTGVEERHVAPPGTKLYTLAAEAGTRALRDAGLDPAEVDLVLVATVTHELLTPAAATVVAFEIGAYNAAAMDVGAACTGFLAALNLAAGQIESGRIDTVLVIGAELLHRHTDPDDRPTAGLFGDGAGAAVVRATSGGGRIGRVVLGCDGAKASLIEINREDGMVRMQGHDTFVHAVNRMSEATLEALESAGRSLEDVDLFVYHQANSRIIKAVGERLDLPPERVIDCVPRYGNTSAASIPIALCEAEAQGMLEDGSCVLAAAFGAGLTWGATVIDWGSGDEE
jgi:3-oxoacyl-[acyl-carrier-protein] synthase-3